MDSGIVRLELAPPMTLGRRLQYAFLSLFLGEGGSSLEITGDYAIIGSRERFLEKVNESIGLITSSMKWGRTASSECDVTVSGINCCDLDAGPKFYVAGTSDYLVASNAGLDICKYRNSKGEYTTAWTHSALSYALKVIEEGGPLGGEKKYAIPILAKSTLFSGVRGAKRVEVKELYIDIDTLGSILLGGAIAFLGRQKPYSGGNQKPLEFYVIPDTPNGYYSLMRSIAATGGLQANIAAFASTLSRELNTSLEVGLMLALARRLYEYGRKASEFGRSASASARVFTVTVGKNRPMVRGGLPLSLVMYESYSESTIKLLSALSFTAIKAKGRRGGGGEVNLDTVVSNCIEGLYLQTLSPCNGDYVYNCTRDLLMASSTDKLDNDTVGMMRALIDRLVYDYRKRIARRCR